MRLRSVMPEGSSYLSPFRFSIDHQLKRDFRICRKTLITKNTRMKHSGMLPSHCRCRPCFEQPEKRKTPCASPVRYTGRVFTPLPFPLFYRSSAETGFSNMQKALITRRFIKIKQGMKWNCSMKYSKEEKQMSKQRSSGPHRRILVRLCALALIAAMLLTSAYAGGAVESGPAVESLATENLDVQNTAQPRARRLRKARRPKPTPRRAEPGESLGAPAHCKYIEDNGDGTYRSRSM